MTEEECCECGLFASSSKQVAQEEDSELDEFGRRKPSSVPQPPLWPPNFESHGSDYVLDHRSGMFYEPKSNFFYDPTTKLYYSHDKQSYFRHRLGMNGNSVYEKVENSTNATDAGPANTDKQMIVPAISINLKTKALPKKTKKKTEGGAKTKSVVAAAGVAVPRKAKEHEADLSKWSERQTEVKAGGRDLSKIKKTAKGEPICSLCQRKFATLDKLFYHEKASELHKTNLAKQAAARKESAALAEEEKKKASYVDRAEQRRLMHGPETTGPALGATETSEGPAEAVIPVDPKETLNETNIGNKMLQKLGWQQGTGLGRRMAASANELEQDWERIERLAAANRKSGRNN
mmetsp:Transcript_15295/g.29034  ORF Transcript_15295/g.29034 Transcript_15295/m.29034 type:complete len:348 (-) Transcript_15295:24-1067(-)